jgi:amino-acid N-acetyltransferase
MIIRRAKKSDSEEVNKLVASFPQYLMSETPAINRFFVAIEDGKIVGCCALDIYSKRIAEVRSLAVYKEYHHLGIGTQLVTNCINLAKEKNIKEILVITSRPSLFSDLGFGSFQGEKLALFKRL